MAEREQLRFYGRGDLVKKSHQITIPTPARKDLGIDVGVGVLLVGDLKRKRLILVREPPPGKLLDLATDEAIQALLEEG